MGEIKCVVLGVLLCLILQAERGQSVHSEKVLIETFCDLPNVTIACGKDEIFAVESLEFYYHPDCETRCCSYNSTHANIRAEGKDIQMIRRECSGRKNCSLDFPGVRDFGSNGLQKPSYAFLRYYCIPGNRTTSICASKVIESNGLPLYLTNENYPSVTTKLGTCSCSIEVNTCSSNISLSILDLDLYNEQNTCEQRIELRNGKGDLLDKLNCGDYNNNSITVGELRSHYVNINFINNSTENQEGFFLIGFAASEEQVSFSLSCPFKSEEVCLQCEDTISIRNGDMVLQDVNDTSEGALANITCDTGYKPDKSIIKCLDTGLWENATCLPLRECEKTINITNGDMLLHNVNNTKEGALANISCHTGYEPDKYTIKCLKIGKWEEVSCSPIDCGNVSVINNGNYELVDKQNTTIGAVANVNCDEGYESDDDTITCLDKGEWSSSTCTVKDCGSVNQLQNGKVSLKSGSTKFGAVAYIVCDTGYTATSSSINCLSTGKWETVTCNIKDCGMPPKIDYGNVALKEDSKTTYKSTMEIKCDEGYEPTKQTIKCKETGVWESSSCKHLSDDGESKTGTIIAAIFIPILLISLLVLGICCFIKYQRQGYLLSPIGSKEGHERVSFKNKEVLPDDDHYQNTNLVFSNETAQPFEKSTDSRESQDKIESQQKVQKTEESNVSLNKEGEDGTLNDDDKKIEAVNNTNETNGSNKNIVTEDGTVQKESSPKEDDKVLETNDTSSSKDSIKNEDVKGEESIETKADAKEDVENQISAETTMVGTDDPKEDTKEVFETNDTNKSGQNDGETGQELKDTNEPNINDSNDNKSNKTSDETCQVGKEDPKEEVKDQEPTDINELNGNDNSKNDKET